MTPLAKVNLHTDANAESRIGDNVRNPALAEVDTIERILADTCPLAVTCDVRPVHPPFFTEFAYYDVLNGVSLATLSAEVSARMAEKASRLTADKPFPLGEVMDKYRLAMPPKKYRKVVFLAGSNSLNLIDQSALQRLMIEDDEWMIKLHPVTQGQMIRDLALIYGYHRLIDRKVSGMLLLDGADEIAALSTSELFLVARLMGKPVRDLTRFDRAWLTSYYSLTRLCDGSERDAQTLTNALMSDLSGHLRAPYGEARNRELAYNYYTAAMAERETFRLVTNQRLTVADKTFIDWK